MTIVRQIFFPVALAGLVFLSFSLVTRAADCDRYAADAVAAQKLNEDNNCGFKGDQWGANPEPHKLWCLTAQPHEIQREYDIRNRMITACQNVANDCLAYSEVAVAQQWANINRHAYNRGACKGDAWNYDQAAHERWCLRVSPEQRRNETLARAMHIKQGGCYDD